MEANLAVRAPGRFSRGSRRVGAACSRRARSRLSPFEPIGVRQPIEVQSEAAA